MAISAGTTLGRYEVRSLLGAGGMGEVYLAQDTQLRRPVALKLLPVIFTQDEDRLRRFEQEAYAASALNHPNILTIYEIGHIDSTRNCKDNRHSTDQVLLYENSDQVWSVNYARGCPLGSCYAFSLSACTRV